MCNDRLVHALHRESSHNKVPLVVLRDDNVTNDGVAFGLLASLHSVAMVFASAILQGLLSLLGVLHVLAVKVGLATCGSINSVQGASVLGAEPLGVLRDDDVANDGVAFGLLASLHSVATVFASAIL